MQTETLETLVRALAERPCSCNAVGACQACWKGEGIEEEDWEFQHDSDCERCTHGTGLDSRFDALRMEPTVWSHGYNLDTSLGAGIRAAAACGYAPQFILVDAGWHVSLDSLKGSYSKTADIPEEALFLALTAAVS